MKKLVNHEEQQATAVKEIFGLEEPIFQELLSWSPQPSANVQVRFRGENFISRALINPTVKGCPACLREDLQSSAAIPQGQMAMRGDWQVRHVEVCVRHVQALVPLWSIAAPLTRYDFSTQLGYIADDIISERLDQPLPRVTSYDLWLDERLSLGEDSTWLSTHAIDVSARFCQLLGAEMIRLIPDLSGMKKPARELGFECAHGGPDALSETMLQLASHVDGSQFNPQKVFGRLYRWVAKDTANDPRCDPFRDIMREVILQSWAIPAGEVVLGKSLTTPRLHSVLTASKEIGRSAKTTRQLLEHAGIVDPTDDRHDARLTFDAKLAEPALMRAKRLVMAREMTRHLGVSSSQFQILVDQNVLHPAVPQTVSKLQWDIADADALLEALNRDAVDISPDDPDWLPLGIAAGRARVSPKDAIDAVRDGLIQVGRRRDLGGYAAIYARQNDMEHLREEKPDLVTLSAFGREVGLHQNGAMTALFDAGYMPATLLFNPTTRRNGLYVSAADIAAFHAKFTSLKLLSSITKMESRMLSRRLRDAGISRFAPDGQDFGPVYVLEDIRDFLGQIKPAESCQ